MMNWQNNKWVRRFRDLLKQGLSSKQIALSITIGAVVGVIPMVGVATFLLTVLALYLRLNLPIAFFITYAVTPVQWLLFIPFIHFGELILFIDHSLLSYTAITEAFNIGAVFLLQKFFWEIIYGITAWCLLAFPLGYVLYQFTRMILTRMNIGTSEDIEKFTGSYKR